MSHLDIWPHGEGKGIPSVVASQKEFAKRGYEVYFVCPLRKENLPQKEDYEGIHIFRFRLPFNVSSLKASSIQTETFLRHIYATFYYNLEWFFFQIFGFYWLLRFTSSIKPHLIYVHTITPIFISFIVSRIFHTKLVVRVYGAGDLYHKWSSSWYRIKEFRDYLSLKVPADYFIVTNDGTNANLLIEKLGVPSYKIRNWRNGIDFGIYDPSERTREEVCSMLKVKSTSKIIISTSRIMQYYGVDILIQVFPVLFKENTDTICVFIGEGPDRKSLENYVNENNLEDRVFFLGFLRHEILNKFLNASDIFVLLSRFSNCSNTMWEAMVCGKCIVTTENDNIKEVLKSGENAILVSPRDFGKLPEILNNLLSDDELKNRLGKNARLRAEEVLQTWPERIRKEVKLLEELFDKK